MTRGELEIRATGPTESSHLDKLQVPAMSAKADAAAAAAQPTPEVEMPQEPAPEEQPAKRPLEAEGAEGAEGAEPEADKAPAESKANGGAKPEEPPHKRQKKPTDYSKYAMNVNGGFAERSGEVR